MHVYPDLEELVVVQRRDDARPPHALTLGEADQPGLGALGGGAAAAGEVRCQVSGARCQVTCTCPWSRSPGGDVPRHPAVDAGPRPQPRHPVLQPGQRRHQARRGRVRAVGGGAEVAWVYCVYTDT